MKSLWTGPSHHDVISAKAQGGNTGTFSILFMMVFKINSTNCQLYIVLIFSKLIFPKCTNVTGLVTERVKCKGTNQRPLSVSRLTALGVKTIVHFSMNFSRSRVTSQLIRYQLRSFTGRSLRESTTSEFGARTWAGLCRPLL